MSAIKTEQELREQFKKAFKEWKGDKPWGHYLEPFQDGFYKGYSLAQETIEKQKKDIEELKDKNYKLANTVSFGDEDLREQIKAKDAEIEKLKNLFNKAKAYIDECPCDPDIYPDQLKAWNEYQEELKKLNKNLDGKY